MHCVDFIKTLCSEVLATFADQLSFLRFLTDFQWKKTDSDGFFQDGWCVGLAIGPITQLIHHWS